jgi:hypothetical protein
MKDGEATDFGLFSAANGVRILDGVTLPYQGAYGPKGGWSGGLW